MTGDQELARARSAPSATDSNALAELWARHGRRGVTSESVFRTLREAILTQALQPGARLAEEELAGRFSISRTPVREAIVRLEAEGLADRSSGRTASVTELRPQEIVEIYEVRAVIDALAAELSAERINPPQLSNLEWINERMRQAGEAADFTSMAELNLEFHTELSHASGNTFLVRMARMVHDRVRRFPGTTFAQQGRWKAAVQEHEAILAALRSRDPQAAATQAREHMKAARDVRISMIE